MVKTFTDQISATAEARAQAEARAAEMGAKLGFTTLAVTEFFRILGEQNVPEDKLTLRLVEIATHFSQTRSEMAALDAEDPGAAELVHQAQAVLDAGRLNEAEGLLGRARALEMAAYRQALELRNKAQEAQERHALNGAKLLSSEGRIALTRLHYMQAADDFGQSTAPTWRCRPLLCIGKATNTAITLLCAAPSRVSTSCWRKGDASKCRSPGRGHRWTSALCSIRLACVSGRRRGWRRRSRPTGRRWR
jgi:hypothetical protein